MIREEAVYFAPQGQTKIMNEGWASYWHTTLMTRHLLKDSEVIDYADHHSGTTAMRPGSFNPYKVGLELWRDIEERWNRGQFGKEWMECEDVAVKRDWDTGARQGRQKIFEVRRSHNDITFVDTFLTEDFVRKLGLFTVEYDRKAGHYVVDKREFRAVKQKLLHMLATRGNPRLLVTDGNRGNRGELQLEHQYDGADIQLDQAEQTLGNLALLWGRPAHLSTQIEGKKVELHHDGSTLTTEGLQRGKKK
jgi:stage V sporulation protein R